MKRKRVRIAQKKYVVISDELAAKAERVLATSLTREQVVELLANEPPHASLMVGSRKPLALSKSRQSNHGKTPNASLLLDSTEI